MTRTEEETAIHLIEQVYEREVELARLKRKAALLRMGIDVDPELAPLPITDGSKP